VGAVSSELAKPATGSDLRCGHNVRSRYFRSWHEAGVRCAAPFRQHLKGKQMRLAQLSMSLDHEQ